MKAWAFRPHHSHAPQWHYAFSRFADEVDDFSEAFEVIVQDFIRGEQEQFATEGDYGSGGWRPLSPKYAAWKESVRPGRPILVFNGDLRRAATNPRRRITKDSLTIVVDDTSDRGPAKALYHQEGTPRMPARPVIELPESQRRRWMKIFQSFLVYKTRGIYS